MTKKESNLCDMLSERLLCLLVLSSVCAEAQSLCSILSEASAAGLALDLSPELTRAVTNVICSLCFSSSYSRGNTEFESMLQYSQGIVDTVAKDSLVDVFPWLQVDTMSSFLTNTSLLFLPLPCGLF